MDTFPCQEVQQGIPHRPWPGWSGIAADIVGDADTIDHLAFRARQATKIALRAENDQRHGVFVDWQLVEDAVAAILIGTISSTQLPYTQAQAPSEVELLIPCIVLDEKRKRGKRTEYRYCVVVQGQHEEDGEWMDKVELRATFPDVYEQMFDAWKETKKQGAVDIAGDGNGVGGDSNDGGGGGGGGETLLSEGVDAESTIAIAGRREEHDQHHASVVEGGSWGGGLMAHGSGVHVPAAGAQYEDQQQQEQEQEQQQEQQEHHHHHFVNPPLDRLQPLPQAHPALIPPGALNDLHHHHHHQQLREQQQQQQRRPPTTTPREQQPPAQPAPVTRKLTPEIEMWMRFLGMTYEDGRFVYQPRRPTPPAPVPASTLLPSPGPFSPGNNCVTWLKSLYQENLDYRDAMLAKANANGGGGGGLPAVARGVYFTPAATPVAAPPPQQRPLPPQEQQQEEQQQEEEQHQQQQGEQQPQPPSQKKNSSPQKKQPQKKRKHHPPPVQKKRQQKQTKKPTLPAPPPPPPQEQQQQPLHGANEEDEHIVVDEEGTREGERRVKSRTRTGHGRPSAAPQDKSRATPMIGGETIVGNCNPTKAREVAALLSLTDMQKTREEEKERGRKRERLVAIKIEKGEEAERRGEEGKEVEGVEDEEDDDETDDDGEVEEDEEDAYRYGEEQWKDARIVKAANLDDGSIQLTIKWGDGGEVLVGLDEFKKRPEAHCLVSLIEFFAGKVKKRKQPRGGAEGGGGEGAAPTPGAAAAAAAIARMEAAKTPQKEQKEEAVVGKKRGRTAKEEEEAEEEKEEERSAKTKGARLK